MYDRYRVLREMQTSPGKVILLIEDILKENVELKRRLQIYETTEDLSSPRQPKDSHNSSVPPSRDIIRRTKIKNSRMKSGKKPGGQRGHKGTTLRISKTPDTIIKHRADKCKSCGKSLKKEKC